MIDGEPALAINRSTLVLSQLPASFLINARSFIAYSRKILSQRKPSILELGARVRAVVILLIYEKDGLLHILLTKRSHSVSNHKDEISFPGGALESNDRTLLDAALREFREELGAELRDFEVLGELDEIPTIATNFVVHPMVLFTNRLPEFKPNREEVSGVIEVPLHVLADTSRYRQEGIGSEPGKRMIYSVRYGDYIIWGATARILLAFFNWLYESN